MEHKIEKIDGYTDRIKVPNGWLYRTMGKDNNPNIHTTFVSELESHKEYINRCGYENNKR